MSFKNISKPIVIAATSTVLAGGVGGYVWNESCRPPMLEVYVFALSNGRSMFVRTPDDKRVLIDGGGNSDIVRELTKIMPFYSHHIDMVIATNSEGKNISGLIDVIERYKVDMAYIPAFTVESLGLASSSDQIYATFLDSLELEGIQTRKFSAGMVIPLDGEVSLGGLFPAEPNDLSYSKSSAPEVLFNISFGLKSLTFLGNASVKVQKYLAVASLAKPSDVLVVSHSALPANISQALIDSVKPEYLVYSKSLSAKSGSVQKPITSSLKTKKKTVIDPLAYIGEDGRFNIQERGTVKITIDGNNIKIENSR